MKSLFTLLIVLLVSPSARAQSSFWTKQKGQIQFHHLTAENGLWVFDTFLQDEQGFLELIQHRAYSTKEKAEKEMASFEPLKVSPQSIKTQATTQKAGGLWVAQNQWSWDWEEEYAKWVRENANKEFFAEHKIPADCADAAYAFRWIFSRIHRLPMVSRLANGTWMSHESSSSQWSKYPSHQDWKLDRRFQKAIDVLLNSTYTHTLMKDSYPVAINPETFMEGVHHLELHSQSGHTMMVHRVRPNSTTEIPLELIWATVPRDLANLSEGGYWRASLPEKGQSGFLRMLWPLKKSGSWRLASQQNMPNYSEEQYQEDFLGEQSTFSIAVIKKISPEFDPKVVFESGRDLIDDAIEQRIKIAQDGFDFCQQENCSEGTANYENWSTPSRDKRLLESFDQLERFIRSAVSFEENIGEQWLSHLENKTFAINGEVLKLNLIRTIWYSHGYSSEPWAPLGERWATNPQFFTTQLLNRFEKTMSERKHKWAQNPCASNSCKTGSDQWKSWSFLEIDTDLKKIASQFLYYCKNFSSTKCEETLNLLKNTKLNEESAYEALLRTSFYDSDPNSNPNEASGEQADLDQVQVYFSPQFIDLNGQGLSVVKDNQRHHITEKGMILKTFHEKDEVIFHFKNDVVVYRSFESGTYMIWSRSEDRDTLIPGNQAFIVFNENNLAIGRSLFSLIQGQVQQVDDMPVHDYFAVQMRNGGEAFFPYLTEDSTFAFVALNNRQWVDSKVAPSLTDGIPPRVFLLAKNDDALIFQMLSENKGATYRYSLKDQRVEKIDFPYTIQWSLTQGIFYVETLHGDFEMITLDDKLNIVSSLPILRAVADGDSTSNRFVSVEGGTLVLYHLESDGTFSKTTSNLLQDLTFGGFLGDFYTSYKQAGDQGFKMNLSRFADSKTQFTADYVFPSPDSNSHCYFENAGVLKMGCLLAKDGKVQKFSPYGIRPFQRGPNLDVLNLSHEEELVHFFAAQDAVFGVQTNERQSSRFYVGASRGQSFHLAGGILIHFPGD